MAITHLPLEDLETLRVYFFSSSTFCNKNCLRVFHTNRNAVIMHDRTRWCLARDAHRGSGLLEGLLGEAGYVVDDGGEVGGPEELHLGQADSVCLHHPFDACTHTQTLFLEPVERRQKCGEAPTCTKGIGGDEIKRELVGNLKRKGISGLRFHPQMSLRHVAFEEA